MCRRVSSSVWRKNGPNNDRRQHYFHQQDYGRQTTTRIVRPNTVASRPGNTPSATGPKNWKNVMWALTTTGGVHLPKQQIEGFKLPATSSGKLYAFIIIIIVPFRT